MFFYQPSLPLGTWTTSSQNPPSKILELAGHPRPFKDHGASESKAPGHLGIPKTSPRAKPRPSKSLLPWYCPLKP